ncbi:MAG: hypothetical protein WA324_19895 [Bryobacteraceae bacterium]
MPDPVNYPTLTNPAKRGTKAEAAVFAVFYESYLRLLQKPSPEVQQHFCEEAGEWFDTGNIAKLSLPNRIVAAIAWLHVTANAPLELPTPEQLAPIEAYIAHAMASAQVN